MIVNIWTITTCIPEDGTPLVSVFGSEREARAKFDEDMRSEWETNGSEVLDDNDEPRPYPGDPQEAHDLLDEYRKSVDGADCGEISVWGRYSLQCHSVEIPG